MFTTSTQKPKNIIHFNLWGNSFKRNTQFGNALILSRESLVVRPGDEVLVYSRTNAELRGTVYDISEKTLSLTASGGPGIKTIDIFTIKDLIILKEVH